MRNRTRLFVTVASATLAVGVATAGVASYVGLERIGFGGAGATADLAFIPTDVEFVAFADVRQLLESGLRHTLQPNLPTPSSTTDAKNPLEEIGLNVETDVDSVVVAALPGSTGQQTMPLVVAHGRFDAAKIEAALRNAGGVPSEYQGTRMVANEMVAVAFVETGTVVVVSSGFRPLVARHEDQRSRQCQHQ